jgi:uncharacterized protein
MKAIYIQALILVSLTSASLLYGQQMKRLKNLVVKHYLQERYANKLLKRAREGNKEVIETYLEEGGNLGLKNKKETTLLLAASGSDNVDLVRTLLQKGASVNTSNINGCTPLMRAAKRGVKPIVEALIAAGANLNAQKHKKGVTALSIAAHNGHKDTVQVLLQAGANKAIVDKKGRTARMRAEKKDYREIADLLQ